MLYRRFLVLVLSLVFDLGEIGQLTALLAGTWALQWPAPVTVAVADVRDAGTMRVWISDRHFHD
jgi:hypothetical protein